MGCCGSTERACSSSQKHQSSSESAHESRAPPPCAEEETVKEVLSVTPEPNPTPLTRTTSISGNTKEEECKKHWVEPILPDEFEEINGFKVEQGLQEVSDVSEICSLSLSESVSTAITDKRDDEDEVRQRVARSPAKSASRNGCSGDLGPKRERVVGMSPTRVSERSPAKRNGAIGGGSVRMVHSREVGQFARGGSRPDPSRRDPVESSWRRTGLNATNRSTMGRSPPTRKTNRSPARARLDSTENVGRRVEEEHSADGKKGLSSTNTAATTNESLENPLVSLECFIFL